MHYCDISMASTIIHERVRPALQLEQTELISYNYQYQRSKVQGFLKIYDVRYNIKPYLDLKQRSRILIKKFQLVADLLRI